MGVSTHLSPQHTALRNDPLTSPLRLALLTNFNGYFFLSEASLCSPQGNELANDPNKPLSCSARPICAGRVWARTGSLSGL